jgi:hypothetical protein
MGRRDAVHAAWPIAACAASLLAFRAIGSYFFDSYTLDLGSLTAPNPRQTTFLFYWALFGSVAVVFLAVGTSRSLALLERSRNRADARARTLDSTWIAAVSFFVFAAGCAIRLLVLHGAPLTDDEGAYRFMAQLLASGRLWADSHPLKVFFDRVFMINDGKFYSQYFIGWPLLMAPAVYAGATGFINAVYAALTVPALFAVARRLAGPVAARVATVLFAASPMLLIGSATELSHPSCVALLTWTFYFFLRSTERPEAWWTHSAVAGLFAMAFLVRPTSALGAGLPMLAAWVIGTLRRPARIRLRALAAFAVPAIAMAAVFLAVNRAQNGSIFVTAYARMQDYMKAVNYEWVGWSSSNPPTAMRDYILPNGNLTGAVARTGVALVRLTFDLFGSPLPLVLVGFAWAMPATRLVWLTAASYVAVHFFLGDSGIDSFGPVHFYEMSPALLLLAGVGAARLGAFAQRAGGPSDRGWTATVTASLVVVSLLGFVPVRLGAVERISANVNGPIDAVRSARLHRALVFSAGSFVPQDCIAPTRHFVYFRPNNDPDLENDVLWVNHLGWEDDKRLAPYFPGRSGYLLMWKGCRPELMRIW